VNREFNLRRRRNRFRVDPGVWLARREHYEQQGGHERQEQAGHFRLSPPHHAQSVRQRTYVA
jgi:hypothetical protein